MNTITKILGKDISSIVFKYLTMSKLKVKTNHSKLITLINIINPYYSNWYKPKQVGFLNKYFYIV